MALKKMQAAAAAKPSVASRADLWNGWAFGAMIAGWVLLLLGRRVLVGEGGLDETLTFLGAALLVGSFGQRVWAVMTASPDRRGAAAWFAVLSAIGILALLTYALTTEWGRELLGVEHPKPGKPDTFGDVTAVAWVALFVVSFIPSVLGEIARLTMTHAERFESRRVISAVVAGIAVSSALVYGALFTYAGSKVDWSADFSYFRVARPSESTKRMVERLDERLEVQVFFSPHSELRPKVMGYFEELRSMSDRLDISVHDREAEPDVAKEAKVNKGGVVVLKSGEKREILDIGEDEAKAAPKLKKLDGEFQKTLMKVVRSRRTVYLTVGHGELNESTDVSTGRSAKLLKDFLTAENYTAKDLGISQGLANAVPDDADMVLVLGPTQRFSDSEVESLRRFAIGGGRLLLALDPDSLVDHGPLAAIVGIGWKQALVVNDDVLVRVSNKQTDKKNLVVKRFSSHAAVSTLSKAGTQFPVILLGSAPLDKLDDADKELKIDLAGKSVPASYLDLNGNWAFDKDTEKRDTFNVIAVVSRAAVPAEGAEKDKKDEAAPDEGEMRAYVVGDADAFNDIVLGQIRGNQYMIGDAIRWLGGEESFSGEISSEEDVAIVHTKEQDQLWFYSTVILIPSLVGGIGFLVSRRTRKKKAPPRAAPKAEPREPTAKKKKKKAVAKAKPADEDQAEEASGEGV
jgi:hypothetical protein